MFWDWFSKHYNDLGENFENEKILADIDDKLGDLGGFAWRLDREIARIIN